jgi:4'-phosphopantetheinyl transferase
MNVFWLEQSEADLPQHDDWLSAGETVCLDSMHFPKRRREWKLGRWTAKCTVATYLKWRTNCSLAKIEILASTSGAPTVVMDRAPSPMAISISHRAGRAICVVAPLEVALGCDLELIEPHSTAFVLDYFTAEEQYLLHSVPPGDQWILLALLWSAKESALKALQLGLRASLHSVVVFPGEFLQGRNDIAVAGNSLPACHSQDLRCTWHPMHVRCGAEEIIHGWWQRSGEFVRTMISAPPSRPPLFLESQLVANSLNAQSNSSANRTHKFSLPRCT